MTDDQPLVLFPEDTTPYLPVGSITIPAQDLLRALVAVVHAAATDDDRPILAAVAIQPRETADAVRLIATDNYRIAMCDVDADLEDTGDWRGSVPAAVEDVKRLVAVLKSIPDIRTDECTAHVVLTLGMKDLDGSSLHRLDAFVSDETPIARLPLRVVDGLYPNTELLIPAAPEHIATFNPQYLSEAAKFGGAADPDGGGLIRQTRSGTGAFVFVSGRFIEIVMPVKETPSERSDAPGLGHQVVDAMAAALERSADPDAHDPAAEAARRLLEPMDGTTVSVTFEGRTITSGGREVDPETGEILDTDDLDWVGSEEGQAALNARNARAAREAAEARRKAETA